MKLDVQLLIAQRKALEAIQRIALTFEQEGNSRQRKAALKTIANLARAVV